jgi:flagellar basal-body rod protein FlgG
MANALTPGYQREVVAARPLRLGGPSFAALVGAAPVADSAAQAPAGALAPGLLVQTDTRPGTLRSTGQSLDVALAGAGYFEVATPGGPAYTRQGSFRLDGQGRLVTQQGHAVMGLGGEIHLQSRQVRIDAQGNIFDAAAMDRADRPIAQLKVVQPAQPSQLRRLGEGLMAIDGQPGPLAEVDIRIQQGFVENSNVSSMHEMVQLMQTMRHFESMQKVALGYDEMTGQAIRKLGEL